MQTRYRADPETALPNRHLKTRLTGATGVLLPARHLIPPPRALMHSAPAASGFGRTPLRHKFPIQAALQCNKNLSRWKSQG